MKTKLCIFDLDGTLLDTAEDIAASMNRVLKANGYPEYDIAWHKRALGLGARDILLAAVTQAGMSAPDSRLDAMFRQFQEDHSAHSDLTEPYGGICRLLERLDELGIKLAVISNKPEDTARALVGKHFGGRFKMIYGDGGGKPIKPDPHAAIVVLSGMGVSAGEAVYIGDTEFDIIFAKNAGLFGIGALWGFRERRVLEEHGADALAETPERVLDCLP